MRNGTGMSNPINPSSRLETGAVELYCIPSRLLDEEVQVTRRRREDFKVFGAECHCCLPCWSSLRASEYPSTTFCTRVFLREYVSPRMVRFLRGPADQRCWIFRVFTACQLPSLNRKPVFQRKRNLVEFLAATGSSVS